MNSVIEIALRVISAIESHLTEALAEALEIATTQPKASMTTVGD